MTIGEESLKAFSKFDYRPSFNTFSIYLLGITYNW